MTAFASQELGARGVTFIAQSVRHALQPQYEAPDAATPMLGSPGTGSSSDGFNKQKFGGE